MKKTSMQKRFKKLAERHGYKIVPVATKVNGRLTRRPDIMGVDYRGRFIMVIPKRMYGFPLEAHKDLSGYTHPDYFSCEETLTSRKMVYGKV